ncbi:MAG: hypothetical protein SPLUMA2_SPLUMAMAG2_01796 [uncultured Sulfurimonas sp.]|nr:MAG: hypothetical protein SPLUMA1_SPLUMAMAG1_01912 [uncultured Sulfurimonas sp.]CAI6150652.1 MAG: hypothetical protein SPLUMA2_SPLUMAMAG2_01796 [uncultured Sulfurimonas sp.]
MEYLFIFASLIVLGTIIYVVTDTVKHLDNKVKH